MQLSDDTQNNPYSKIKWSQWTNSLINEDDEMCLKNSMGVKLGIHESLSQIIHFEFDPKVQFDQQLKSDVKKSSNLRFSFIKQASINEILAHLQQSLNINEKIDPNQQYNFSYFLQESADQLGDIQDEQLQKSLLLDMIQKSEHKEKIKQIILNETKYDKNEKYLDFKIIESSLLQSIDKQPLQKSPDKRLILIDVENNIAINSNNIDEKNYNQIDKIYHDESINTPQKKFKVNSHECNSIDKIFIDNNKQSSILSKQQNQIIEQNNEKIEQQLYSSQNFSRKLSIIDISIEQGESPHISKNQINSQQTNLLKISQVNSNHCAEIINQDCQLQILQESLSSQKNCKLKKPQDDFLQSSTDKVIESLPKNFQEISFNSHSQEDNNKIKIKFDAQNTEKNFALDQKFNAKNEQKINQRIEQSKITNQNINDEESKFDYETYVNDKKNYNNLMKNIFDDPINELLKETRQINKNLMNDIHISEPKEKIFLEDLINQRQSIEPLNVQNNSRRVPLQQNENQNRLQELEARRIVTPLDHLALISHSPQLNGLSQQEIDQLNIKVVDNYSQDSLILQQFLDVNECSICLNDFKNFETVRQLLCNHQFHKKCVDTWLKSNNFCPLCKRDIKSQFQKQIKI